MVPVALAGHSGIGWHSVVIIFDCVSGVSLNSILGRQAEIRAEFEFVISSQETTDESGTREGGTIATYEGRSVLK